MQKVLLGLMFAILCFGVVGCQSKEEKALRDAKECIDQGNYQQAIDILEDIPDYPRAKEELIVAKYEYAVNHSDDSQLVHDLLLSIGDSTYKNSVELLENATYELAVDEYNKGGFDTAKRFFEKLASYKDSKSYLENIDILNKFQGKWQLAGTSQIVSIDGWRIEPTPYTEDHTSIYELDSENEILNDTNDKWIYYFTNKNDSRNSFLNIEDVSEDSEGKPHYMTKNVYEPESTTPAKEKKSPSIGMTAQEVRDSAWGNPVDINRTTTAYGVSEQWVYSGYRYIYLDDGIVTVIQD